MVYKISKQNKNLGDQGMSLIELLLYIAILTGLMIAVSNIFILFSRARGQSEAKSEVNAAMRFAVEKIRQDIKGASAISTPTAGGAASTLSLTVGTNTVTYSVVNGQVKRTVGTGTPDAITGTNIYFNTPVFTQINNINTIFTATTSSIQMQLNAQYNATTTDWTYTESLRTTASLR